MRVAGDRGSDEAAVWVARPAGLPPAAAAPPAGAEAGWREGHAASQGKAQINLQAVTGIGAPEPLVCKHLGPSGGVQSLATGYSLVSLCSTCNCVRCHTMSREVADPEHEVNIAIVAASSMLKQSALVFCWTEHYTLVATGLTKLQWCCMVPSDVPAAR